MKVMHAGSVGIGIQSKIVEYKARHLKKKKQIIWINSPITLDQMKKSPFIIKEEAITVLHWYHITALF